MHILVAEDHPSVAEAVVRSLRKSGYAVDQVQDGEEAEAVVDGFEGFVFAAQEPCRIAGGNFALLDGDVDNFQFPGDVARAENMRDGGLLGIRGGQGTAGRCVKTGGGEIKPGSGGVASEREQNFVRLKRFLAVVVRDAQPFPARAASDLEDSASKDKLGPVPLHAVLHRIGHIAVHRTEDLLAALDNGDVRPEGAVVVGHLESDGPGTQNEERFRGMRIIQDVIADQWLGLRESGNVGMADDGARGDENGAGGDGLFPALAEAHRQFVRAGETGVSANQFEASTLELLGTVFGKPGNEALFAFDDFRPVESGIPGVQPELPGFAYILQPVGRLDERLARHASAQNA